ncbi:MAG: AMP-binding protein, partial [Gammaproteobacteria bacterium]|nr:AMP-binding protein [Gammaproteobacteria bacterium]
MELELELELEKQGFSSSVERIKARGMTCTPLSYAQQRLWFLQQLSPEGSAYNSLYVFSLQGEVSHSKLQAALQLLLQRHHVLASTFESQSESVVQIVQEKFVSLEKKELQNLTTNEQEVHLQALVKKELNHAFCLKDEIPIRASLLLCKEQQAYFTLNLHHIVMDAWSVEVLLRDFVACYHAVFNQQELALAPLSIQYSDYALWQRETLTADVMEQQLLYWKNYVADIPFKLDFPTDYQRPTMQSEEGGLYKFSMNSKLCKQIEKYAQQQNISPFPIFMASWQIILQRYSGQNSFLIGVPNANRNRFELEELIGCFINTQLFKADLESCYSPQSLIDNIAKDLIQAQNYQDFPFDLLVEKLDVDRDPSHNPLFQVMFNYQSDSLSKKAEKHIHLPDAELSLVMEPEVGAKCDLVLNIHQNNAVNMLDSEFTGSIEYATALFKGESIERLVQDYQALLKLIITEPTQDLRTLSLLSDEQVSALRPFEQQAADYSLSPSWLGRFAEQVAEQGEAVVIYDAEGTLTWQQLDEQSNVLAAYLQQSGVVVDDVVAILGQRNRQFIVALIGILKAGGAWLPLGPEQPSARWQQLLDSAQVRVT